MTPWWLTTKYNFDPEQGSSQAYYDATTGRQVFRDASGRYAYVLPKEAQWGMQDDGNFGWSGGVQGQYVPDSLLNSQIQNAQVVSTSGTPNGTVMVQMPDGRTTYATQLNGDAGDYSKLLEGIVPGTGIAQVDGQGAPQTQIVQGSDGNRYAALPSDVKFHAPKPDNAGFGSLLMQDFAPLAMAALPFSGLGSALSGALGGGTLGNAGAGAIINAGTSLLTGGDPLTGAIKGGAGALINPALSDAGVPSAVAPFVTNAAISAATGGDVGQSLLNTAANTGIKGLGGLIGGPEQSALQYTMSGGDQPSSVDVQNIPADSGATMDYNGSDGWLNPDPNPGIYTGSDGWLPPSTQDLIPNMGADGWMPNETPTGGGSVPISLGGGGLAGQIIRGLLGTGGGSGGSGTTQGWQSSNGLLGNGGLLLPLLGGLLGGMSGGAKPAGTTTTVNDIPDWQKPYVTNAFTQAGNALADANAAYAATKPTTDLATNNLNATLRGDYLGSNPALDNMFNTAANQVASKVNSQFSAAGRYGSGAQTSTLTEGLGNLANNIYGQNYQQERQRQFAGSLAAPSYTQSTTQAAYGPASGYANIVRQPVGSTQQSPYFTNPLGGAVSGLLGGYALSRM